MKILAVDDDPIIMELLTEIIHHFGDHILLTASSAHEAIEVANRTSDIDCFMLDIQMPGMDGIELCKALRQMNPYAQAPVLMLTAMSEKRYIDAAFAAGATDYVNKPFDVGELRARINLIDGLVAERRVLADKLFTTHSGRRAAEKPATFAMHLPFDIRDIDGIVDAMALENYVTRLSRNALYGSTVFAVSIRQVEKLYAETSTFDFQCMIVDVAESLSDTLNDQQFLAAYMGNGTFACVVEGGSTPDFARFTDLVNIAIKQMGLHCSTGRALDVRVATGKSIRLVWRSGQQAIDALAQAHISAEEKAHNVEKHLDQFWYMEQSA